MKYINQHCFPVIEYSKLGSLELKSAKKLGSFEWFEGHSICCCVL
jgi:hypothetical protein